MYVCIRFRISRETLARFVLMVRRGYRDPPYHNWTHAFTVAHFAFLLIDGLDLLGRGVVSDLEALALFLACLCHDLDHRGTNNTFQVRLLPQLETPGRSISWRTGFS